MQLTGVAVSKDGRLFVSSPSWAGVKRTFVGEVVVANAEPKPYPNEAWNSWDQRPETAGSAFVCVQSVIVTNEDPASLWVLDPASPDFGGVVPGGAKLVRVNLASGDVTRVYTFDDAIAPKNSYLNDVRIWKNHAFISDSHGTAIVVLNLKTGIARRLLDDHPAVQAEAETTVTIGGTPWLDPSGKTPQVGVDGIALHPGGEWLYFQALTGKTLYRVPTAALLDEKLPVEKLGEQVERVATTFPADGIEFLSSGELLLTSLEDGSIKALSLEGAGITSITPGDPLPWPDSIAVTESALYVTTSQIHWMPPFNAGVDKRKPPYIVYRVGLR